MSSHHTTSMSKTKTETRPQGLEEATSFYVIESCMTNRGSWAGRSISFPTYARALEVYNDKAWAGPQDHPGRIWSKTISLVARLPEGRRMTVWNRGV